VPWVWSLSPRSCACSEQHQVPRDHPLRPGTPQARAGGTAGGTLCLQQGAGPLPHPGLCWWMKSQGRAGTDGEVKTVPSEPGQSRRPGWGAVNTRNAVGRRDESTGSACGAVRRLGIFGNELFLHTFFLHLIFFCSNSRVKNSFREPEPAAEAPRPAVGTGNRPGTVPLHPSSSRSRCSGASARVGAARAPLAPSPAELQPRSPTPTPFSSPLLPFGAFGDDGEAEPPLCASRGELPAARQRLEQLRLCLYSSS